ncbi:MAG: CapA protein [uncultured Acidimicrobiales bacterium]|uniref:CapA protein n=1 Tax=uncultured Acidimicrobiales bacterium TaxID=310071 RepID=A0A6J4IYA3_9ACTN|nr:MAG: CapA protein [uncultured Acidimicrobiales bacterium]
MAPSRADHLPPRQPSARVRRNRAVVGGAVALVVAILALVAAVANRGGDERVAATSPTQPPTTPGRSSVDQPAASGTSPSSSGSQPGSRRGNGQAVTIAFGGDVHFEGQIRSRLQSDPASVMAGVAPVLRGADVAVVNLETAVTSRGTKPPGKEYAFRAPPSAFAALQAGGVDVASMANNHGMDYGRQGLEDSLEAARSGQVAVVGIGRNADEAYRPFVREVKGQRIAVIGATQVLDDDLRAAWTATDTQPGLASAKEVGRLTAAVRRARAQANTVVVYLHWGTEGQTCPNEAQPVLARALAEAGADVIVGGHAHRLQGAGRLGSAFVAYGLGNFAFYSDSGPGTETGVLTVTVAGRDIDAYRWTPARLVGQLPRPLTGAAADRAVAAWESLRGCTGLTK